MLGSLITGIICFLFGLYFLISYILKSVLRATRKEGADIAIMICIVLLCWIPSALNFFVYYFIGGDE